MVDENGMDGHTTIQPEQYHPWVLPSLYNCNNFLHRTVEAVLGYAYTGIIELTVGSAERIYLLAHNLKCKRLMKTCIQFLNLK